MALLLKPYVGKGKAVVTLTGYPARADAPLPEGGAASRVAGDPEEALRRNHLRSVRRTRQLIGDYAQEFRLCYMWTLTYRGAGQHDWTSMVKDVRRFQRRLKGAYPGLSYVVVPEWHPGGHGIHLHLAVGEFIPWQKMRLLWTDGDRHPLAGSVNTPRTAKGKQSSGDVARYLAKYISKSISEASISGKRFYRPHGQDVTLIRYRFGTMVQARRFAIAFFDGEMPAQEWESTSMAEWDGPLVAVLDWNEAPPRRAR